MLRRKNRQKRDEDERYDTNRHQDLVVIAPSGLTLGGGNKTAGAHSSATEASGD